jgi:hypothetical protein
MMCALHLLFLSFRIHMHLATYRGICGNLLMMCALHLLFFELGFTLFKECLATIQLLHTFLY